METHHYHWPMKGEPQYYTRGLWHIVRYYDPVQKRCRVIKSKDKEYVLGIFELKKQEK